VLELGSGTGLVGLVASRLGAEAMTQGETLGSSRSLEVPSGKLT